MSKVTDLLDQRFGRLVVFHRHGNLMPVEWDCVCDCGRETVVRAGNLKSGNTTSCGCLRIESSRERFTTHGKRKSPEFNTWALMIQRCTNPKNKVFPLYGGRGILVCDEWRDNFQKFFDDMGPKPSKYYSIDRIDNSLGYSPDNCRWAHAENQANNRRNNRLIEYQGEKMTIREAMNVSKCEVPHGTVRSRIFERGWEVFEALNTPVK
jgi:hypothetical protein